jgi:hypothetical protein
MATNRMPLGLALWPEKSLLIYKNIFWRDIQTVFSNGVGKCFSALGTGMGPEGGQQGRCPSQPTST